MSICIASLHVRIALYCTQKWVALLLHQIQMEIPAVANQPPKPKKKPTKFQSGHTSSEYDLKVHRQCDPKLSQVIGG